MASLDGESVGSGGSPMDLAAGGANRASARGGRHAAGPARDVASGATDDLDDLDAEFVREEEAAEAALQRCLICRAAGGDVTPAGDAAGDVRDAAGPRHAEPAPGVQIIDPAVLDREIGYSDLLGEPDERPEPTSPEDERRLAVLRRHADAPGGLFRRHVIAGADTLERLAALRREAPNGARVVDVVERAATLSWRAGSPLRVPPLLIVGGPGTGKTRLARRIAEALGVTAATIDGGATTDRGPIVGHDVGYRGAGPGRIAQALLDGPTAGPLVLVDEIDKVSAYTHGVRPLDALLPLLEPATAASFMDTWVSMPMRADGVTIVMTANSIKGLAAPLLDRCVVIEMPALRRAEARDAIRRVFAELLAEHGLPPATLGEAAVDRLQTAGLRQTRRTLLLALGPALAAGRDAPDAADVAGAFALVGRAAPRPRRSPGPKPATARRPVGFLHFPPGCGAAERRSPTASRPGE